MRVVYATELQVPDHDSAARARAVVRHWVSGNCADRPVPMREPKGSVSCSGGIDISWLRLEGTAGEVFEVTVEAPDAQRDTLRWRTVATIGVDHERTQAGLFIHLTIGIVSTDPALTGPVAYSVSPPPLVETLLQELTVVDGDSTLSAAAIDDAGLIAELAVSHRRRLPVLIVSPDRTGSPNPNLLARSLAGLCHVTAIAAPGVPTVPVGAARLLWAGWHPDRAPQRTEFWSSTSLHRSQLTPEDQVARTVFAAAALRLTAPDLADRLRAEHLERRAQRLAQQRSEHDLTAAFEAWEADLAVLDELRSETAALRSRVRASEDQARAASAEAQWWQDNFDKVVAARLDRMVTTPDLGAEGVPRSVAEALAWAEQRLARIAVTSDARHDGERFTFARPAELYADLVELDRIAGRWASGALGTSPKLAALEAGLPYRAGISQTAEGRYGHDYSTTLDGVTISLGPHLHYGGAGGAGDASLAVYLALEDAGHCIIVGRLMRHGRDATSH